MKAEIEKHSAKTPNYKVATYEDFRHLLEKEKAVDAILCATPDHLHAYVSISAMRLKKHEPATLALFWLECGGFFNINA